MSAPRRPSPFRAEALRALESPRRLSRRVDDSPRALRWLGATLLLTLAVAVLFFTRATVPSASDAGAQTPLWRLIINKFVGASGVTGEQRGPH